MNGRESAMLDQEAILREATRVRRALEVLAKQDEGKLKDFPNQCCDIATHVLGLRLYDLGLRGFAEHLAYVEEDRLHRWLDVGGLVVDITADQFGEPAVIVSADSQWHLARAVQERIAFAEKHVELLRSFSMARYTRLVFESIQRIVDDGSEMC
jgi:hypothetical protein